MLFRSFKQLTALLVIAFLATLILFAAFGGRDRREIARLEQNCLALTDSVKAYRVSDSLNAVQVKALRLTASEYKELYTSEHELVKSLRADNVGVVKNSNIEE